MSLEKAKWIDHQIQISTVGWIEKQFSALILELIDEIHTEKKEEVKQ
jgi:hypothetical protein